MIVAALVFAFGTIEPRCRPACIGLSGRLISGSAAARSSRCRGRGAEVLPLAHMAATHGGALRRLGRQRLRRPALRRAGGNRALVAWAFPSSRRRCPLRHRLRPRAAQRTRTSQKRAGPGQFSGPCAACLALGITSIAAAGDETRASWFPGVVLAGLAGIALSWARCRNKTSRLFPAARRSQDGVGSGMLMVAALADRPVLSPTMARSCWPRSMTRAGDHRPDHRQRGGRLVDPVDSGRHHPEAPRRLHRPRRIRDHRGGRRRIRLGRALGVAGGPSLPSPRFRAAVSASSGRLIAASSRQPPRTSGSRRVGVLDAAKIGYALGSATAGIIANANGSPAGSPRRRLPPRLHRCSSISFP